MFTAAAAVAAAVATASAAAFGGYRIAQSVQLDTMNAEAIAYAHMVSESYKDPEARDENVGEFTLDRSCSGKRIAIYFNRSSNSVVFVFRGTTFGEQIQFAGVNIPVPSAATVVADINIAGGLGSAVPLGSVQHQRLTARLEEMLRKMSLTVAEKYNTCEVYVAGHSLGGMIALSLGARHDWIQGGHVFNAGAGGREAARLFGIGSDQWAEPSKKIRHHHVFGDGLSMFMSRGELTVYRPRLMGPTGNMNPHAMSHFIAGS